MNISDQKEYRATADWPYSISAGCLVYRSIHSRVEVLLLKRTPNHEFNVLGEDSYNLPKGHVERDETLEQAAIRETAEEAGIEATIAGYLGAIQRQYMHPVYKLQTNKTTHYFGAAVRRELPSIDAEHDEAVWVELDEAVSLLEKIPKGEDEIAKRLKQFLELTSAA